MKRLTLLLVLALAFSLSGCFKTHIITDDQHGVPSRAVHDTWHHAAVLGLLDVSGPRELNQICPNGWVGIDVQTSFINSLATNIVNSALFGFRLWGAQTVTVRCKGGQAFNAAIDPDGHVLAVADATAP
jgi:hypothetical protein